MNVDYATLNIADYTRINMRLGAHDRIANILFMAEGIAEKHATNS